MTGSGTIAEAKHAARIEARRTREAARAADSNRAAEAAANLRLLEVLAPARGAVLAGYWPIGSELSVLAVMTDWAAGGAVGLPVVTGKSEPLAFRRWSPACEMGVGAYGVPIPADPEPCPPSVVIVPLLAFDRSGIRLGYGGGFYDRTLAALRSAAPVFAIGVAYGAQEAAEPLPREATDSPLDAVATEHGVFWPEGSPASIAALAPVAQDP